MGCGSSNASQNETSPMTALVSRPVTKKETKLPEVTGSPIGGPADPGRTFIVDDVLCSLFELFFSSKNIN